MLGLHQSILGTATVRKPGHCNDVAGAVWSTMALSQGVPHLGTSISSASQCYSTLRRHSTNLVERAAALNLVSTPNLALSRTIQTVKENNPRTSYVGYGSEVVAVMTSPVDAHLIAKPLSAQIWTSHPNSTDATLLVGDE
eukprot:COSAG02_NODE_1351_length_13108_cov_7.661465_4_plen_140_part_00